MIHVFIIKKEDIQHKIPNHSSPQATTLFYIVHDDS